MLDRHELTDSEVCGVQERITTPPPAEGARIIYAPDNEAFWALIRGKLLELLDEENYSEESNADLTSFIDALKPSIYKSALEDVPPVVAQIYPQAAQIIGGAFKLDLTSSVPAFLSGAGQVMGGLWTFTFGAGQHYKAAFLVKGGTYVIRWYGSTFSTGIRADWDIDGVSVAANQNWNSVGTVANVEFTAGVNLSAGRHVIGVQRNPASAAGSNNFRLSLVEILPLAYTAET